MCRMQMYGRKNLRILYDAISTLCDAVGGSLAEASSHGRGFRMGCINTRTVCMEGAAYGHVRLAVPCLFVHCFLQEAPRHRKRGT